jgi:uncharacterized protein YndB with AHSA1/START domain
MSRDIVQAIEIHTAPRAVYDLIATKAGLARFWTPTVSGDEKESGELRFGFAGAPMELPMKVAKLDPGRSVAWECPGGFPHWQGSRVDWTVEPSEHGAKVIFKHRGFPGEMPDYDFGSVSLTWATILKRLKEVAEGTAVGPALK